jgi:hypothetical protein
LARSNSAGAGSPIAFFSTRTSSRADMPSMNARSMRAGDFSARAPVMTPLFVRSMTQS